MIYKKNKTFYRSVKIIIDSITLLKQSDLFLRKTIVNVKFICLIK